MNQLKRKALLLIANNMAPEEVAGLRSIFQVRRRCSATWRDWQTRILSAWRAYFVTWDHDATGRGARWQQQTRSYLLWAPTTLIPLSAMRNGCNGSKCCRCV